LFLSFSDRKESLTSISSSSGTGSTAKWSDLNWATKIAEDSTIFAVVSSGTVPIGRIDINPKELLSIPLNTDKLTEVEFIAIVSAIYLTIIYFLGVDAT